MPDWIEAARRRVIAASNSYHVRLRGVVSTLVPGALFLGFRWLITGHEGRDIVGWM